MKTIGLLGGMSWESTLIDYRLIEAGDDLRSLEGRVHEFMRRIEARDR
jgi:aspartate/glutamate racemase